MSDEDRAARERAQAQQVAQTKREGESGRRAELVAAIRDATRAALIAQKEADSRTLEVVEVRGWEQSRQAAIKLAKFVMEDRGTALFGEDYLLVDGTFAASYEGRPLVPTDDWEQISTSRLERILDALREYQS